MPNLRLENSGGDTRVFDRDTGKEIDGVTKVEFIHSLEDGAKLVVTITDWNPEVMLEPEEYVVTKTLKDQ